LKTHLDALVETGAGEGVEVLGIETETHDEMAVSLELGGLPILLPVPELDAVIIRRADDARERRMHHYAADKVAVRLEGLHLLHRVVIEDPNREVVRPHHYPI
jgi:hypothetical protein